MKKKIFEVTLSVAVTGEKVCSSMHEDGDEALNIARAIASRVPRVYVVSVTEAHYDRCYVHEAWNILSDEEKKTIDEEVYGNVKQKRIATIPIGK